MAAPDASLEELQTRLVTFTEQLENIHELMQGDPNNAEFLGIAKDLVEVIRLTQEMVALGVVGVPHLCVVALILALYCYVAVAPGSACEALSQGVWYPAHVESVTSDDLYKVHFLGFGTVAELPAASLRAIDLAVEGAALLPPKHEIAEGFACQAKYYADSQMYPCTVTKVTSWGFQVLFGGYGNSEEVPYEYLRPSPPSSTASGTVQTQVVAEGLPPRTSSVAKTADALAPAAIAKPIKIPENLQILPTDSEAEKERKRKRVRAIKSLNRHKNIDNERNVKQHDWKAFQHKAKKKKLTKGVSGVLSKRGSSMFASPDTVQGRVGVVGSGQGMTAFQDARNKKPKLS
ncbi:hypothetical protein BBJ28_00006610 [Nothophytophthora sp. Chile5]|nr:hypothetical protein BBJ28_00006610 [Nothophytophthora sp. Chile5]